MSDAEVKVRESGPYKVEGAFRLVDSGGAEFAVPDPDRPVALCRCGGSTTKPFCDGTHSEAGFEAAERAVRKQS